MDLTNPNKWCFDLEDIDESKTSDYWKNISKELDEEERTGVVKDEAILTEDGKWITIGHREPDPENDDEGRKGRHIYLDDGETPEEAINKLKKDDDKKDEPEKKESEKQEKEPDNKKKEFKPFGRSLRISDFGSIEYSSRNGSTLFENPNIDKMNQDEKEELYEKALNRVAEIQEVQKELKDSDDEEADNASLNFYSDIKEYIENDLSIKDEKEYFDKKKKIAEDYEKKGEINGVKRGNKMTFEEADNGKVNPKYVSRKDSPTYGVAEKDLTPELQSMKKEQDKYRVNCQTCVVAFEARMRGYNVQATGNTKEENSMNYKLSKDVRKAYIDPETGAMPKFLGKFEQINTDKRVAKFLDETVKEGERYNFSVNWKYGSAHIVSVFRENGKLVIYDPQSNKKYDKETLITEFLSDDKGKSATLYKLKTYWGETRMPPRIYRVDNMLFNPKYTEKVLEA